MATRAAVEEVSGSDGSDGTSEYSGGIFNGEGSGLDLSNIQMENFVLSPGAGGMQYEPDWKTEKGGGGGGVLVNGESPMVKESNGQGYGGGAGGAGARGAKGVVLFEIMEDL